MQKFCKVCISIATMTVIDANLTPHITHASLIANAAQFLLVNYHRLTCYKYWHFDIEMVFKVWTSQTAGQPRVWLIADCVCFFFQVEEALNEVDFHLRLDLHFTDVEQQYVLPPLLHSADFIHYMPVFNIFYIAFRMLLEWRTQMNKLLILLLIMQSVDWKPFSHHEFVCNV